MKTSIKALNTLPALTEQPSGRNYDWSKIGGTADSMETSGVMPQKPISIASGEAVNPVDYRSVLEGMPDSITVGNKKHKREDLLALFDQRKPKTDSGIHVIDGRGRCMAACIRQLLNDVEGVLVYAVDVTGSVYLEQVRQNVADQLVNTLSGKSVSLQVIEAMQQGKVKTEADVSRLCGLRRGMAQAAFARARLVVDHGLETDYAVSLDKEQARKLAKNLDNPEADKAALVAETSPKGTTPKPLTRRVILALAEEKRFSLFATALMAIANGEELIAKSELAKLTQMAS